MNVPISEVKEALKEINSETVAQTIKFNALTAVLFAHGRKILDGPFSEVAAAAFTVACTLERQLAFTAMLRLMKDDKFEQDKLEEAVKRLTVRAMEEQKILIELMGPVIECHEPGTLVH